MSKYSAKRLKALWEGRHDGGRKEAQSFLSEGQEVGGVQKRPLLRDFSLKELCKEFAPETHAQIEARMTGHSGHMSQSLLEAGTPTNLADFSEITGQLMFNEVRDGFQSEEFVFSGLVPVLQSRIAGTEKVPEITPVGDVATEVLEGEEYPTYGFGSAFYTLPAGLKKGFIVEITEEAIFFDLTGQVAGGAQRAGRDLGLNKEKRIIDVMIGASGLNNYTRNGVNTSTYLAAGAYVNASVIALVDETDLNEVEQAMNDILHPDTSEPIELLGNVVDLICVKDLERTAMRIARSTEVRQTSGSVETIAPPTLMRDIRILSSRLLKRRILAGPQTDSAKAATWWFYGSLAEAFGWKENWALQTFMQGADGPHAFSRDVPVRWKGRYRGEAYAREPRKMYRAGDAT